jgi:hypothetical protein
MIERKGRTPVSACQEAVPTVPGAAVDEILVVDTARTDSSNRFHHKQQSRKRDEQCPQ